MADQSYVIKNVVRRVQTRLRRQIAPGRLRFKQYIGNHRLLRNQLLVLKEDEFNKYLSVIEDGVRCGSLEVVDPQGTTWRATPRGEIEKIGKFGGVMAREITPQPVPPAPVPTPPAPELVVMEQPDVDFTDDVVKDNLTDLPHIGVGRARKLEAAGVISFSQISEMSPMELVKLIGAPFTEDHAIEACEKAMSLKEK